MNKERLNPLNDYMFLKIMGEKGDEEQLCSFLNAVLEREGRDAITSVEIIENKTMTAEVIGDKTSILDVRSVTAAEERISIEVQLRNLGNMDKRSLFYWSKEFSRGMEAGQDYREAPDVIAINIVNYEFMPDTPDFHLKFHIWEDKYRFKLTEALGIHFIDMVKFKRLKEKDIRNNKEHLWLAWLDKDSPRELLEEIAKMEPAIMKAAEKMARVSMSKEALRAYQMREMAMSDWTSGLNHARLEGKLEGRLEGKLEGVKEGKLETARNMKSLGIHPEMIGKATGLSPENIAKL